MKAHSQVLFHMESNAAGMVLRLALIYK